MDSSQPAKGCFKCGGTGHWARDCPAGDGKAKEKQETDAKDGQREWKEWKAPTNKKKAAFDILGPKRIFTRPKLSEDLLLSKDKGIGYILQDFPKLMEIKGKGHEVGDLRRLLELYHRWHKMLFPSVAYGDFVDKVEKLGAKKRVRSTICDLRQKIVNGEDEPYEPADVQPTAWGTAWEKEMDEENAKSAANTTSAAEAPWPGDPLGAPDDWETGIGGWKDMAPSTTGNEPIAPVPAPGAGLTAEQKARIEANKARALALRRERAAQAAEGRAAGTGLAEEAQQTASQQPPAPEPPAAKSRRQRLADESDDDDDVTPNQDDVIPNHDDVIPDECDGSAQRRTEERAAAAQKKRTRREMLSKLAARRKGGRGEETGESEGEEEENTVRRRRPDRDGPSGAVSPRGSAHLDAVIGGATDGGMGVRTGGSDGVEAELEGYPSETQPGKRRRLLKADTRNEPGVEAGLEDGLMDDVEVRATKPAAKGRRVVVLDSDDEE